MIDQSIDLNLVPKGVLPRIHVTQYDNGSRVLIFAIYNDLTRFTLTSQMSARIQGTKPDKHGFDYAASIDTSNNIVTADVTQQMTAVAGDVTCEIVINKSGERIGTLNFVLAVQAAGLNDETIVSDTEIPDIVAQATAQMEAAAASALQAEGYAVGKQNGSSVGSSSPYYHNNASYYNTQAKNSATSASSSASTATSKASEASTSAGNAATSAQNAATSAGNASTSATSAAADQLKSEGFAVGTQNGVPVDSSSPYYHNNAEWYSRQTNPSAAQNVTFDRTVSGIGATNVQDAVDQTIGAYKNNLNANGSKNILPFDIEHIYENNTEGSWGQTNKNYTHEGVKYMVQNDGSVIVNRESSSSNTSTFHYYYTTDGYSIPVGVYRFSGLPSAGSSSTFRLRYALYYADGTNTGWKYIATADGGDVTINDGCVGLKFGILVYSGGSPSNQVWKPMICLKSDWDLDPTWEPPTPTNRTLDRDKVDWKAISQIGSVNIAEPIADTQVVRNVTLTKQDDGTWTCSADSATSDVTPLVICRAETKAGQVYKLSGTPRETVALWVRTANVTSGDNIVAKDAGNGAIFISPNDGYVYVQIRISEGVTLTSSDVFKPMITPVDYNGPYVPYAKSNKGLTDDVQNFTERLGNIRVAFSQTLTKNVTTNIPFSSGTYMLLITTPTITDGAAMYLIAQSSSGSTASPIKESAKITVAIHDNNSVDVTPSISYSRCRLIGF